MFLWICLLCACGRNDLAGGSVEIPSGLARGVLVDLQGRVLPHAQIRLVPVDQGVDSTTWIQSKSDASGQYEIVGQPGVWYRLIVRDSSRTQGASLVVQWKDSVSALARLELKTLGQVVVYLEPGRSIGGFVGVAGTDVWLRDSLRVDSVVLPRLPQGKYQIVYRDDSTKILRNLGDSLVVGDVVASLYDRAKVLIYAVDSTAAKQLHHPLQELGISADYVTTANLVPVEGHLGVILGPGALSTSIAMDLRGISVPLFCLDAAHFWALGMTKDDIAKYQNSFSVNALVAQRLDVTSGYPIPLPVPIYLTGADTLFGVDAGPNALILLKTEQEMPLWFWHAKDSESWTTGVPFMADRIGLGVKSVGFSAEMLNFYRKAWIHIINGTQPIPF